VAKIKKVKTFFTSMAPLISTYAKACTTYQM